MKDGSLPPGTTARPAAPGASRFAWLLRQPVQIGLILLLGLGLYIHTLNAPFIFDDYGCIAENPAIRDLGYFLDFDKVRVLNMPEDIKNNFALRPVVYLTFALNYMAGGFNVFGFHLVNTAIHLANALLIYLLVTVTLKRSPLSTDSADSVALNRFLPLLVALFFVAHPLQTQAVTYITQRFASLAACFYLGALLLYICARTTTDRGLRWLYYGLALITTILAMKTKGVAFTLPVIMLLYELFFLMDRNRTRLWWILPFFLTMGIVPATLAWLVTTNNDDATGEVLHRSMNLINFAEVSRWDYLKTQFGVMVSYLRMLLLPYGQNLDHDYRLAQSFWEPKIFGSFLLLLTIFGVAIVLALRSSRGGRRCELRLISFGILWFFITISITSSIIPIDDLLVEHRLYLPSYGFFLAMVVAAAVAVNRGWLPRSVFICGAPLLLILLCATTYARNELYRDPIRMYQDVVAKSPDKPRAHSILGTFYLRGERYQEAINEYMQALKVRPRDSNVLMNLGCVYYSMGQYETAIIQFQRALQIAPDDFRAYSNLGMAYFNQGRVADAEREWRRALELNGHFLEARDSLAHLYDLQGRTAEAIEQYQELVKSHPEDLRAVERLQQLTGNG